MNESYSILVIGCKKHEQIADRYYKLANIFWPSSLKETVFCTDTITDFQKSFSNGKIISDNSGSFANRIEAGVATLGTNYIILLLDDYYLTKSIDENEIQKLINYLQSKNINYCKLIGLPKCFKKNKDFGGTYLLKKDTHYGISLQPSIWKKEALLEALSLCKGLSAWEVEAAFSSYQKLHFKECLTYNKNFLHYKNGVLRGKLFPYTNRLLSKNDIEPLNLQKISYIKYLSFSMRQHISTHLPVWIRKIGKKIGKKHGKTYYSED